MALYEKNFSALLLKNPSLAHVLSRLSLEIPYEIFMENEALETLNLIHTTTFAPLYATKPHVVLEVQKEQFNVFQEYPYLYFFGMGNGALLKHLLANKNTNALWSLSLSHISSTFCFT